MSTLRLTTISNQTGSASVPSDTVINGSAKAWVNFNGTGTVAIRASFNVTSITDNGTGDYTVNFTTALEDANYCVSTAIGESATGGNSIINLYTPTSSSFRFTSRASSANTFQDSVNCCSAIFR